MNFSELKKKTWIDWVKVLVAVDIASVGIGLILGGEMHALAYILGFITRIPFGVLYLFIAVLILKRVFPEFLHVDEKDEMKIENVDEDITDQMKKGKGAVSVFFQKAGVIIDRMIRNIDAVLDNIALFFTKRKKEVLKETNNLMDVKPPNKENTSKNKKPE